MKILSQTNNLLTFELEIPEGYTGKFDILVFDEIDYDTFQGAEGFYLNATNK